MKVVLTRGNQQEVVYATEVRIEPDGSWQRDRMALYYMTKGDGLHHISRNSSFIDYLDWIVVNYEEYIPEIQSSNTSARNKQ